MSDQLKESLSAAMDGETDEFELRRVLDEASADPALRSVWERYHLVRSVMHGDGRRARVKSLGEAVWRRIDAGDGLDAADVDATHPGARRVRRFGRGQRLIGVAVAAGVAAVVMIGFRTDQSGPVESVKVASAEPAVPPARLALFDDEVPGRATPAALDVQRAHAYMLHHARHVALNNRGVVPFVKVAAFEPQ